MKIEKLRRIGQITPVLTWVYKVARIATANLRALNKRTLLINKLIRTLNIFLQLSNQDIADSIDKEMDGDLQKAFLTLGKCKY